MENGSSDSKNIWRPLNDKFSTLAIHAGYTPGEAGNHAVTPAITMSTTFQLDAPAKNRGFEYSRTLNPNRQILEKRLAALEGAKHGACFSSGMSAISAIISLLKRGDHIVCSDDVYGGANRLMKESIDRNDLQVDFVDLSNSANLKTALKSNSKMVFLETPANPTLKVFDIKEISRIAHEHNSSMIVTVDNTVLTSFLQQPLELGADLVHYSLTKFANGHADVIMGAVITNKDELIEKLTFFQNAYGAIPSPFDCYLVLRGLKTLHLRMPALMENAIKIANFLESHSKVEKVFHPGLKSHPQNKLAMQQSSGHSSLLSFRIKEGSGTAKKFLENLKIFCNAGSFGGCESLAELPAFFTHIMVPIEQRLHLGITDNFVRLSVGLESAKDLIDDLSQALDKC